MPRKAKRLRNKGTSMICFPDDYVVVDIETTGLDPRFDAIIEVAAIRFHKGVEIDRFQELVRPDQFYVWDDEFWEEDELTKDERENLLKEYIDFEGEKVCFVDSFITELTGITNEMLVSARTEKLVLKDFLEYIGDDIIVGHNVNFDINFLFDAKMKHFQSEFKNDYVDTMRLGRRLLKELRHHRLEDLADYYRIDYSEAHRALKDSVITHLVLGHLKNEAIKQYGSVDDFIASTKQKSSYNIKDIVVTVDEIDEDNFFFGMSCCFTGTLEKMPRKEAMQLVVNSGGAVTATVTKKTNYLILGNFDYNATIKKGEKSSKLIKAEKMKLEGKNIEILSENVFYDLITEEG